MMREIRQLTHDDMLETARIMGEAYPAFNMFSPDDLEKAADRMDKMAQDEAISFYGLFMDEQLVGVMRLYDYQMKLLSAELLCGGIGGVAVDLRHKKKKVAFDMLQFFLRHYRDKGATVAALYPFRPDFYRQMGFGLGTKMNRYAFKPAELPNGRRDGVSFLGVADKEEIRDCYNRQRAQTNGLFALLENDFGSLFRSHKHYVVGYREDGVLRSYMIYYFHRNSQDTFLSNV